MVKKRKNGNAPGKVGTYRIWLWGVCLLCLAAAVIPAGSRTYSKCVQKKRLENATAMPAEFYFYSDVLKEGTEIPTYDIYDRTAGIVVQIDNFADELRISSENITYSIECTGGTIQKDGKVVTDSLSLVGKAATSDEFVVYPDQNVNEVTITATSTAPYEKTLSAKFKLQSAPALSYQIEDSSGEPAATLIILGGQSKRNVMVQWKPDLVSPDNTDAMLRGINTTSGSFSITIGARESCSILFFKADPNSDFETAKTLLDGTNPIVIQ